MAVNQSACTAKSGSSSPLTLTATQAQITFPESGLSILGNVSQITPQQIVLQMVTLPPDRSCLRVGVEARIALVVKGAQYILQTRLNACHKDTLTFSVAERSVPAEERRRSPRRCFEQSVTYRPVDDNGYAGSWRAANVLDISAGGMRLEIPMGVEPPESVEILYSLFHEDQQPIKAMARVVRYERYSETSFAIGLSFRLTQKIPNVGSHRWKFVKDKDNPLVRKRGEQPQGALDASSVKQQTVSHARTVLEFMEGEEPGAAAAANGAEPEQASDTKRAEAEPKVIMMRDRKPGYRTVRKRSR